MDMAGHMRTCNAHFPASVSTLDADTGMLMTASGWPLNFPRYFTIQYIFPIPSPDSLSSSLFFISKFLGYIYNPQMQNMYEYMRGMSIASLKVMDKLKKYSLYTSSMVHNTFEKIHSSTQKNQYVGGVIIFQKHNVQTCLPLCFIPFYSQHFSNSKVFCNH